MLENPTWTGEIEQVKPKNWNYKLFKFDIRPNMFSYVQKILSNIFYDWKVITPSLYASQFSSF